jgi:hypothetical protein
MKKILLTITIISFTFLSFKEINFAPIKEKPNTKIHVKDELYDLKIRIINTKTPQIEVKIELKNNAYFASPLEDKDLKGKFYMDLGDYTNIDLGSNYIENPSTNSNEFGPQSCGKIVKWVRVDTSYKKSLYIKNTKDFEVFGRIKFVIEPRCTMEEIPFGIRYKNGNFSVFEPKC